MDKEDNKMMNLAERLAKMGIKINQMNFNKGEKIEINYKESDESNTEETNVENQQVNVEAPSDDARIFKAICALMDTKDDQGNFLFQIPSHYRSFYRILVDYKGYNKSYKAFYNKMIELGANNLRVKPNYQALKEIDGIMLKPFDKWEINKCEGEIKVFKRYYNIAEQFKNLLEKTPNNNDFTQEDY